MQHPKKTNPVVNGSDVVRTNLVDVLNTLEGGNFVHRASQQLEELNRAIVEHRGTGELTISIKMKPEGNRQVLLTPAVKIKTPAPSPVASIYFVDDNGGMSRNDPRQIPLNFREKDGDA